MKQGVIVMRRLFIILSLLLGLNVACGRTDAPPATTPLPAIVTPETPTAVPNSTPASTIAGDAIILEPQATRVGANYVLQLPREDSVPVNWAMDRPPDFRVHERQPGETYRFACLELPARSIGVASVGYRHLDGLPNVYIEYVVYRSPEDAAAALADMQRAAENCAEFEIGTGSAATSARMSPIDLGSYGQESFAASLETSGEATGELVTHVLKVRQDDVIIGINHAASAAGAPPDSALTESLAGVAVRNLSGRSTEY